MISIDSNITLSVFVPLIPLTAPVMDLPYTTYLTRIPTREIATKRKDYCKSCKGYAVSAKHSNSGWRGI